MTCYVDKFYVEKKLDKMWQLCLCIASPLLVRARGRSFFVNGQLESMPIGPPALHRLASGARESNEGTLCKLQIPPIGHLRVSA